MMIGSDKWSVTSDESEDRAPNLLLVTCHSSLVTTPI